MLTISLDLLDEMIAHCRSVYPEEACGLLAGKDSVAEKIYTMTNAEHSGVSYMMEPGEQFAAMKEMRQEGRTMVAIFHSHPDSPAYPSSKDVELAFYPDACYVIVSLIDPDRPEIRAYEIAEGQVREASLRVLD
ncbi:MAG: M67 family metallopeptidase [Nitrospirae bacterium]|nr:M67 family metallopeptidase [Nitrospirota bacterium]